MKRNGLQSRDVGMDVQRHNNHNNHSSGISDGLRGICAQQRPVKNVTVNNMSPLYWLQSEPSGEAQPLPSTTPSTADIRGPPRRPRR